MGFLLEKCKLVKLDDKILEICHPFTCGDADLDDFFQNDAMRYKKELLGKTYCFILDEDPKTIVCMFTLSNDSIRVDVIPNNRGRKLSQDIPREKRMRRCPGVCRFSIVDAYNNEAPLGFYQKNEFLFLFSTEQQEAENLGYDITKTLHTRLMYYDLKKLTSNEN